LDEAVAETPQAKQEAYAAKRVVELQDLGMEDDPASLETILSELANRDPSIREAAVQAAVQFGSRDAIPSWRTLRPRRTILRKSHDPGGRHLPEAAYSHRALRQQTQPVPDTSAGTSPNPDGLITLAGRDRDQREDLLDCLFRFHGYQRTGTRLDLDLALRQ